MGGSRRRRALNRRAAQTLTVAVVMLPVLVGAMGLATDVGNLYLNYVRLQTAADASVLSGVRYLPDQPGRAVSTTNGYATGYNGVAAFEILSTTVSNDATRCPSPAAPCKLTMNVQRTVPFFFGRVVGVGTGTVNVLASAVAGAPAGAVNCCLAPIGLQYTTAYSDGASVTLAFRPNPSGSIPAGSWSSLSLGGQSFTSAMPTGYHGKVSINDAVAADRSALAGPVSSAIQARINAGVAADSSGSHTTYTANDHRAATIALVDWGATGGCCRIKGFAQLWIQSVTNGNISGSWIAGGVNGPPDSVGTAPSDGVFAIMLVQ